MKTAGVVATLGLSVMALPGVGALAGDVDPWADAVIAFDPGKGGVAGFDDPAAALGQPARMTGWSNPDSQAVTPFNAVFNTTQLVSIGTGGTLTVAFDEPVEDDPANPFGIDLLVFGNAFFVQSPGAGGGCADPCAPFVEGGIIEISSDGENWFTVPGDADGGWPTNGFADLTDPHATQPGLIPSDFTRPIDPELSFDDAAGMTYQQMQGLYAGSGGGTGVDIAPTGLASISFVRISNPQGFDTPEIDGFADVGPVYAGDVTGDGVVDLADLLLVISQWGAVGETTNPAGDTNADGVVDLGDLLTVVSQWGAGT